MIKLMKLQLTLNDRIYTVEDQIPFDGCDICDLLSAFKGLLVSAGFHPSTVDNQIETSDGQWFTTEENNLCKTWKDFAGSQTTPLHDCNDTLVDRDPET